MKDFIAVVAPFKKNYTFRLETEENKTILKSDCSKREITVIASEETDIPCNYVLASTAETALETVEINGKTMHISEVKYFKAKTFFRKDEKESGSNVRAKTITELSLEFGSAAFARSFKKRKQMNEVTKETEDTGNILMQEKLASNGADMAHTPVPMESDLEPVFPKKNTSAKKPIDIYTLEGILGFSPFAVVEESIHLLKDNEISVGTLTESVLKKSQFKYEEEKGLSVWALVFDSISKILEGVRKKKLTYLYEMEDPIQAVMIKKIVKHFIGPIQAHKPIILDKKTHSRLVVRIIIMLLLRSNGVLNIQTYPQCFFKMGIDAIRKLLKEIGCVKANPRDYKPSERQHASMIYILSMETE
ncbi:DNA-directed RNA polymerase I subunit RPA49 [Nematocida ausubeli]|nr:DNA-directed RNA polymerase I subunit RPA49 [Nematocida ausubeli]